MHPTNPQYHADDLYNLVMANRTHPDLRRAAIKAISKFEGAPWYPLLFEEIFEGIYAFPYSESGTLPKTQDIIDGLNRYLAAVKDLYPRNIKP